MRRRSYLVISIFLLAFLIVAAVSKLLIDQIASLPARAAASASGQVLAEARRVRNAFVDLFQLEPKISVNQNAVFDQTKTVLELGILQRDTDVSRETAETWFGSTKKIRIHATYRVRAGFDLSKKLEVNVAGQEIWVKVPRATILSVEPLSLAVDELRDGLWNKIQPKDVDRELEKLPELARAKAGSLPQEAEQTFERLLSQRLGDFHVHVQIESATGPEN